MKHLLKNVCAVCHVGGVKITSGKPVYEESALIHFNPSRTVAVFYTSVLVRELE